MSRPLQIAVFFLAIGAALTPWFDPPRALALGIVLGLAGITPLAAQTKVFSRCLMQGSIVLLGFTIGLADVARAGTVGLALSTGVIVLALAASEVLGRVFRTDREVGTLLSAGTAICGGSAIAATGQVIHAAAASIAVSTAVVFILNAVGVFAYPHLGRALALTPTQYGSWVAIGVHDVAGVVAAATGYDEAGVALQQATVVKLTRVLWIVPVALVLAQCYSRRNRALDSADASAAGAAPRAGRVAVPMFVVYFLVAVGIRALCDQFVHSPESIDLLISLVAHAKLIAGKALTVALLLIGTGLTRKTLATVGWRPAAHGVALWLLVSAAALAATLAFLK
ncbi:putative sulfate exporter family transporter [soil metagenome]